MQIECAPCVFRRKSALAWQHLKEEPTAFTGDWQQSHINRSILQIIEQRLLQSLYGPVRGKVCMPCIIVGLQAYVCIHSAHCKRLWGVDYFSACNWKRKSLQVTHACCLREKSAFGEWNEPTCISARLSFQRLLCSQSTKCPHRTTQRFKLL